jgi:DNA primase
VPPVSVDQKKQVKAANDIVDVVSGYIPVVTAGKEYKAVCPFHNDTRPSLQVSRQYQNFRCWSCGQTGDVFEFVMKFEKVSFGEALRMLADRAGIKLDGQASPQDEARSRLVRAMKWAEEKYRACLMDDAAAELARAYLGERRLGGNTVRQFGLGFAPAAGDWLVRQADRDGIPADVLLEVGLIAKRDENRGFYDRFRDRVMFPIRDARGQTVGFGGRILPSSPYAARGPKYYNSAETPLFHKSELIYGLDAARHAGAASGCLAVVEGYTDVMMAHQHGVGNVVATMGTALTLSHVLQLRRYVPKVVLVFDGDEAGETATDKALELFWSQHDIDITVTTLPDGLDPCDLLVTEGGPQVFRDCLANAQSVLEYKLDILFRKIPQTSAENIQQIVDRMLGVIAVAPDMPSARHQLRQQSAITRIAHRLGLRQETLWARLAEMKAERRRAERDESRRERRPPTDPPTAGGPARGPRSPAPPLLDMPANGPKLTQMEMAIERQLLQLLLAEPGLVGTAREKVPSDTLQHTGLRRMLSELYTLHADGEPADMDGLRVKLLDRPDLLEAAQKLQLVGHQITERGEWLGRIVSRFAEMRDETAKRAVKEQLAAGGSDDQAALDLLRRLQGGR